MAGAGVELAGAPAWSSLLQRFEIDEREIVAQARPTVRWSLLERGHAGPG